MKMIEVYGGERKNLLESFDKPVSYHWVDKTENDIPLYQAFFQIDDGLFVVQFKVALGTVPFQRYFEMSFLRNNNLNLTKTGNAFKVMSTVIAIAREFIRSVHPVELEMAGNDSEPSRNKLYPKLIKILSAEFPNYIVNEPKVRNAPTQNTSYTYHSLKKNYISDEEKIEIDHKKKEQEAEISKEEAAATAAHHKKMKTDPKYRQQWEDIFKSLDDEGFL